MMAYKTKRGVILTGAQQSNSTKGCSSCIIVAAIKRMALNFNELMNFEMATRKERERGEKNKDGEETRFNRKKLKLFPLL